MKKHNTRGPGRPMADIKIPNRKFTFADLCEANDHVTPLTLRKFLKRDAARLGKSTIVLLKNESREPDSKKGLGRKTFVYISRARKNALRSIAKSRVSVPLAPDYETTKKNLGLDGNGSNPTPETETATTAAAPAAPAPTVTTTSADTAAAPQTSEAAPVETPSPAEQVPVAA